jgi:hypothetical protein
MFVTLRKMAVLKVPVQENPFPEYPMLHSHSNDPGLLEHLPFTSHGLPWHSSMSGIHDGDRMKFKYILL